VAPAYGLAISEITVDFAQKLMFRTLPSEVARLVHVVDLAPDYRVFLFVLAAALICTLGFGLAPAIQATRVGLVQASRGDFTNELRPTRLRNALVVSQVAVCTLLLICAAVVLRNGRAMAIRDVHFVTEGVLDVRLQERFAARAAERLRREPWVESIAIVYRAPLYGSVVNVSVSPSGSTQQMRAGYNFVSPDYFHVFRIPLLRGRNFTSEEGQAEAPVVIVSEATAKRFWPNLDPIGQSLRLSRDPAIDRHKKLPAYVSARVIGIARDVISGWVGDGIDSTFVYFPTSPGRAMNSSLLVRVKGEAEAMRTQIDTALAETIPGAVDQVNPMEQVLAVQLYPFRAAFWISSFLGGMALALTVSGIYGVLSYLVGQRTKEIGIRIALGASVAGVVRFVLSQSMRLAYIGIALGVLAALGVAKLFASELVMLNLFDVQAYIAVVITIAVSALARPSSLLDARSKWIQHPACAAIKRYTGLPRRADAQSRVVF
jgi:predicted permease